MKTLILSAGYGTRLRPITATLPKPLIPIFNKPLLQVIVETLQRDGIELFSFNLHHLPEKIIQFLENLSLPHKEITFEPSILGTAGSIIGFAERHNDPDLLIYNGDIYISGVDFQDFINYHKSLNGDITFLLIPNGGSDFISYDLSNRVTDLRFELGTSSPEDKKATFSGIAIYKNSFLRSLSAQQGDSVIDLIIKAKRENPNLAINAYIPQNVFWSDIGTPERYLNLHTGILKNDHARFLSEFATQKGVYYSEVATKNEHFSYEGFAVVADSVEFGSDLFLNNSIILSGAKLQDGASFTNALVGENFVIQV